MYERDLQTDIIHCISPQAEGKMFSLRLPFELLLQIFSHLNGNDVVNFLSTSRSYRSLIMDEKIWRELCVRHGVHDLSSFQHHDPNRSFYTVYTELLHTYGPLIGLWASDDPFHGAILEFRIMTESQEVGWEGIVGELWQFQMPASEFADNRLPKLPDYYECLRIELRPPTSSKLAATSLWPSAGTTPPNSRTPTFSRILHFAGNALRCQSEKFLRLNAPHRQGFRLQCRDRQGYPTVPHTPFPPYHLTDRLLDLQRLPRLIEQEPAMFDHTEHLRGFAPLLTPEAETVLFLAPSQHRDLAPQSISLIPPTSSDQCLLYCRLMCPDKNAIVTDLRTFFPEIGPFQFDLHFFPLRHLRSLPSLLVSEVPHPRDLHDMEDLWLGAYDTLGTEVLFITMDDACEQLEAWKVTGNIFMPRGTMTFTLDASRIPTRDIDRTLLAEMKISPAEEDVIMLSGTGYIGGPEYT
ncbi:F-box protein 31 [Steccherinum ochraceum]|uniref:F-box protein 31 n=1 Tax=Steccherinum ochraceum TaxID=92696 RepID=A0A4R0RF45_9APHY|nr:F-box protein 31 [Steccherinum ochraceum]